MTQQNDSGNFVLSAEEYKAWKADQEAKEITSKRAEATNYAKGELVKKYKRDFDALYEAKCRELGIDAGTRRTRRS